MRDRRQRRRRAGVLCALSVAAVSLAGCAGGGAAGPPVQHGGPAVTWVDVAEPLPATVSDPRRYWESLVEQSALPYWATTYVVSLPNGWTSEPQAVAREVAADHPTVVTVEAGLLDAAAGTPPGSLATALRALLDGLKAAHQARVLVANVPAPVTGSALGVAVAAADSVIAAAAGAAGDRLVDLRHALRAGDLQDGQLTAAGEEAVAAAFAGAISGRR